MEQRGKGWSCFFACISRNMFLTFLEIWKERDGNKNTSLDNNLRYIG